MYGVLQVLQGSHLGYCTGGPYETAAMGGNVGSLCCVPWRHCHLQPHKTIDQAGNLHSSLPWSLPLSSSSFLLLPFLLPFHPLFLLSFSSSFPSLSSPTLPPTNNHTLIPTVSHTSIHVTQISHPLCTICPHFLFTVDKIESLWYSCSHVCTTSHGRQYNPPNIWPCLGSVFAACQGMKMVSKFSRHYLALFPALGPVQLTVCK